ncbi:MAG: hypothetical protein K2K26_10340, partial [Muribaculaceae bacterium]|nr:hypothetical protein [Muribaculaceae bacterium]
MSHIFRQLLVLMSLIGMIIVRPLWVNALNAAPPLTDSPARFFTMSDEELLKKAFNYKSADKPDSALLCYAVAAQRYNEKSGKEELRRSMKAKLEVGNLYYYPFYDYGKAYSLFCEVYDIAVQNNDYEYMGLAANTIGNVLSVYNFINHSETLDREIIDYYSRSVDYLLKADKWNDVLPTINNLMAIAMDTVYLNSVIPVLLKYYNRNLPDTLNDHHFTMERIGGYLKIGEGNYAGAAEVFRKMLSEKGGIVDSPVGKIQVYFDLAGVANIEGRYDSVIYYARKVQEMAKAYDMYEVVPGAYLLEADMYKAKGNKLLGEKTMLKYYEAKDSLMTLSTISLFSEAHLKKKIADIDVELVRVSAENRMRKLIVGFVTALLGVVTVFLFIVWRKNRILIRKNQEMIEKTDIIERQDKIILHHT